MSTAQLIDTCMTAAEARACIEQMKAYAHRFRALALDLYEREGWRALGYASWRACAVAEFGLSQPRVYQLLEAAQVDRNISTMVEIGTIPERHLRPLTDLEPTQQREAYQLAVETAPQGRVTAAHIEQVVREFKAPEQQVVGTPALMPNYTMAVHHSSESVEWYTPPVIIQRVVEMFGAIDLDPCSNSHESPNVPARAHYTKDDNGLARPWNNPDGTPARLYLNPPYGNEIAPWILKLCTEYAAARVCCAIALLPARTDTAWFTPLWDFPLCFVRRRLMFVGAKNSAPFPSVVAYLGDNPALFAESFADLGAIVTRFKVTP